MSYVVCRIQKLKRNALGGIEKHNNREGHCSTNKDIRKEDSHKNYDLISCSSYHSAVTKKLLEKKIKPRKDAVVSVEFIITSDNDFFKNKNSKETRKIFEDALSFIQSKYGKSNVYSAVVHNDEKTPHLHVEMIPITDDGRLSAKSLFDKNSLRQLQTDIAKCLSKYGLERGLKGNKSKHIDKIDFKIKEKNNQLESLDKIKPIKDSKLVDEIINSSSTKGLFKKKTILPQKKAMEMFDQMRLNSKIIEERDSAISQKIVYENRNKSLEKENMSLREELKATETRFNNQAKILSKIHERYPETSNIGLKEVLRDNAKIQKEKRRKDILRGFGRN